MSGPFILMSRERANEILNEVRCGVSDYPEHVIRRALFVTGDLAYVEDE